MTTALTFGSWLKRRRMWLGMTQKELAHRVGYAAVTLRKVEADELRPARQMAQKLAEALELAPDEQAQFVRFARDEAHWEASALPDRASSPPIPPAHRRPDAASKEGAAAPLPPPQFTVASLAAEQTRVEQFGRAGSKHNLPAPATPLIGREHELAELAHLLADPAVRLVTILAAGGMGKTHLGIVAASQQVARFAHGVCWVPLAPLSEAKELVLAIAAALGLQLQGERTPEQQVGDYLQAKHLLLVLDNFEHLLDGASLLGELLAGAPRLSILVTSRQRLKLSSETVLLLDGLPFPTAQVADTLEYPAMQLFLLHAGRVRAYYQPDASDAAGIMNICRLVHGMPLGILLAAAWAAIISPAQIAAEIGRDVGFLHSEMPDVPARQRNLRAVFLHTWDRLSAAERNVFMRMSVFRGGATPEAAQRVTGAAASVLSGLFDKALLWRLPGGRYAVHELLRQFAAEQLTLAEAGSASVLRDAQLQHSRYYLALLCEQEQRLQGPEQRAAVETIRTDFENISIAWRWAVAQRALALLGPAVQVLFLYCDVRSDFRHGLVLFDDTLAQLGSKESAAADKQPGLQALWGKVCTRLGACAVAAGDYPRGEQLLRESLSISTADEERALALLYLGFSAGEQGDIPHSQALLHDCLALSRQCNDIAVTIHGLHFLQIGATSAEAHTLCVQSLALARQSGRPDLIAAELNQMGWHLWCLGDYAVADACWQEGLALCKQLDFRLEEVWALDCLGFAAWGRGDFVTAERYLQAALAIGIEMGRQMKICMCMADLSLVLTALGRLEEAIALARQTVAITRTINGQMFLLLSLNFLGGALLAAGELLEARRVLREAVQGAFEHHFTPFLMMAFYYYADLLEQESRTGDEADALQRRSLAVALLDCTCREEGTWQVFRDRAAVLQAEIAGALPSPLPASAQQEVAGHSVAELVGLVLGEQSQVADAPRAPVLSSRPDNLGGSGRSTVPLVEPLSEREIEVLHLLAQGLTNQQIADALTVVLGTVKAHNHHIFGKLGVSNRVQALARARALALI